MKVKYFWKSVYQHHSKFSEMLMLILHTALLIKTLYSKSLNSIQINTKICSNEENLRIFGQRKRIYIQPLPNVYCYSSILFFVFFDIINFILIHCHFHFRFKFIIFGRHPQRNKKGGQLNPESIFLRFFIL